MDTKHNKKAGLFIRLHEIYNRYKGDIYGIVPIIIAIWGILLTIRVSKEEQKIKDFGKLLSNSQIQIDTLTNVSRNLAKTLSVLDTQLALNETAQSISNKNIAYTDEGEMYRFSAAIYKLGTLLENKDSIDKWNVQRETIFLRIVREILESEISNPYLVSNKPLLKSWMKAYIHSYYFVDGAELNIQTNDGKNITTDDGLNITTDRAQLRLDELGKVFGENFRSCWDAANTAYETGLKYLKMDKRFKNI